jgi:hypothetical protein
MKYSLKHTALAIALVGAFGVANATPLVYNTNTASVATSSFFGGTLLDSAITNVVTDSYTGTARTAVYDTGTGLDFYYQFTNDLTSDTGVERFSAYDFSSLGVADVDVYQTNEAFGIFTAGTETSNFADRTDLGVIAFSFVPDGLSKINPGMTSYTQIIRTEARAYKDGNFGLLNGHAANAAGFAVAAVPEPESLAMLLAGLGLMGTIARRRSRKES